MERLPHTGHVRLEWYSGRQELLLVDTRVDARCIVGHQPGLELQFDESGMAYLVDPTGLSQWASDILPVEVCRLHDSGAVVVCTPDGDLSLWRDYMSDHQNVRVGFKARGAESAELSCFVFARRHGGARVWWSCRNLHSHLSVQGAPSKWYGRHWPEWEAHLSKHMGLEMPHCRRAKPIAHSTCAEDVVCTQSFVYERLLDEPSWSTWALVGLGVTWAVGGSGASSEVHTDSWSHLICGLFDTWVCSPQPRSFACFFGRHDFQVGAPVVGEQQCTFTLTGSVVSWDSSLPIGGKLWVAFLSVFRTSGDQASLMQFAMPIRKAGNALQLLWRQWANHLCLVIEDRIHEHISRRGNDTVVQRGGGRAQLAKLGRFSKMVRLATAPDSRVVQKYFWASRAHFHDQQCVSFAMDFSRISRRSVCVGAVASPDNIIAWAPPQALIRFGAPGGHWSGAWGLGD